MSHDQLPVDRAPRASLGLRLIVLVAVLAAVVIALAILRQGGGDGGGMGLSHPAVGTKLERMSLKPLTGTTEPLSLGDLSGKVALINFWGPWCPPCLVEFPHLRDLAKHFEPQAGFRFVSISCSAPGADDSGLAEETAAVLKDHEAAFATFADPNWETRQEIARVAGAKTGIPYPTTLVIGRDGKILALWFGYRHGLTSEMRDVIATALRETGG